MESKDLENLLQEMRTDQKAHGKILSKLDTWTQVAEERFILEKEYVKDSKAIETRLTKLEAGKLALKKAGIAGIGGGGLTGAGLIGYLLYILLTGEAPPVKP